MSATLNVLQRTNELLESVPIMSESKLNVVFEVVKGIAVLHDVG